MNDIYVKLQPLERSHVNITTKDGKTFSGFVHAVDPLSSTIALISSSNDFYLIRGEYVKEINKQQSNQPDLQLPSLPQPDHLHLPEAAIVSEFEGRRVPFKRLDGGGIDVMGALIKDGQVSGPDPVIVERVRAVLQKLVNKRAKEDAQASA